MPDLGRGTTLISGGQRVGSALVLRTLVIGPGGGHRTKAWAPRTGIDATTGLPGFMPAFPSPARIYLPTA